MAGNNGNGEGGKTTHLLRNCLGGSLIARNELHSHIFHRVRAMARKECASFGRVSSAIDADDVQQEVQAKLDRVLMTNPPESSPALWKLISLITPQVLIDQYRKAACRPMVWENEVRRQTSTGGGAGVLLDPGTGGDDPQRLAQWTEFHQRVNELPEPLGTVFRLIWYKLVPREEVADLLQVTARSIGNYYKQALDLLRPYAPDLV